ncbi:alpha/beta hydrolase [Bacterioplanes sanyensis]|uniref:alpha/beta hydrolase n=1 Tax=Bacterioplanes sanyensis TaxID=1249553 RepID=UPI0012FE7918|nr:alpha/beta fold hydrolase [Bacterioplanes sanyensis]
MLAVLCCLSGCSSLTSVFFYPQQVWIQTPADVGLVYEDVALQAQDGTRLHAWWLPAQQDGDWVVLYLHGNAENISSHFRSIDWLPAEGVSVLALDYRGFGASEGRPMLPAVFMDIEAAAMWLRQRHPDKKLAVLGQSIGAALAVPFVSKAQQRYQIDALFLEAPLASYSQVARHALSQSWIGYLIWPATWLLPSDWDPIDHANGIRVPTMIMHSTDDDIIPYQHGRRVYDALENVKACWHDSQGGHIASYVVPNLRRKTLWFLREGRCLNN